MTPSDPAARAFRLQFFAGGLAVLDFTNVDVSVVDTGAPVAFETTGGTGEDRLLFTTAPTRVRVTFNANMYSVPMNAGQPISLELDLADETKCSTAFTAQCARGVSLAIEGGRWVDRYCDLNLWQCPSIPADRIGCLTVGPERSRCAPSGSARVVRCDADGRSTEESCDGACANEAEGAACVP